MEENTVNETVSETETADTNGALLEFEDKEQTDRETAAAALSADKLNYLSGENKVRNRLSTAEKLVERMLSDIHTPYTSEEMAQIGKLVEKMTESRENELFSVVMTGYYLIALKTIVVKHGNWENFMERILPFSKETANRYMRLYKSYKDDNSMFRALGKAKAYILTDFERAERAYFVKQLFYTKGKDGTITEKGLLKMSERELQTIVNKYREVQEKIFAELLEKAKEEKTAEKEREKERKIDERLQEWKRGAGEENENLSETFELERIMREAEAIDEITKEIEAEEDINADVEISKEEEKNIWASLAAERFEEAIERTNSELYEEMKTDIVKTKYFSKRSINEIFSLFPTTQSNEDVKREIIEALNFYRQFKQTQQP
jgi:hypothetical protein